MSRTFAKDCQVSVRGLQSALIELYRTVDADPLKPREASRRFAIHFLRHGTGPSMGIATARNSSAERPSSLNNTGFVAPIPPDTMAAVAAKVSIQAGYPD